MGHRDEYKPGDLSVRLSFGQVMGIRADLTSERVIPRLEITDQTSGKTVNIELTSRQLTEMLAGSSAEVTADHVTGFKGLAQWGKFQKVVTRTVKTQMGDFNADPMTLPYVAEVIAEFEADGYTCDVPRRNNSGQWVLFGRRYDNQPDEKEGS